MFNSYFHCGLHNCRTLYLAAIRIVIFILTVLDILRGLYFMLINFMMILFANMIDTSAHALDVEHTHNLLDSATSISADFMFHTLILFLCELWRSDLQLLLLCLGMDLYHEFSLSDLLGFIKIISFTSSRHVHILHFIWIVLITILMFFACSTHCFVAESVLDILRGLYLMYTLFYALRYRMCM